MSSSSESFCFNHSWSPGLEDDGGDGELMDYVLYPSCIEGPLLIICATFPTIRRLLTLVDLRSRLQMSGSLGVSPAGSLGNELKTFGAGATRKRLDTLGFTADDSNDYSSPAVAANEDENPAWDSRQTGGDQESELHILQTRTYTKPETTDALSILNIQHPTTG